MIIFFNSSTHLIIAFALYIALDVLLHYDKQTKCTLYTIWNNEHQPPSWLATRWFCLFFIQTASMEVIKLITLDWIQKKKTQVWRGHSPKSYLRDRTINWFFFVEEQQSVDKSKSMNSFLFLFFVFLFFCRHRKINAIIPLDLTPKPY